MDFRFLSRGLMDFRFLSCGLMDFRFLSRGLMDFRCSHLCAFGGPVCGFHVQPLLLSKAQCPYSQSSRVFTLGGANSAPYVGLVAAPSSQGCDSF